MRLACWIWGKSRYSWARLCASTSSRKDQYGFVRGEGTDEEEVREERKKERRNARCFLVHFSTLPPPRPSLQPPLRPPLHLPIPLLLFLLFIPPPLLFLRLSLAVHPLLRLPLSLPLPPVRPSRAARSRPRPRSGGSSGLRVRLGAQQRLDD